MAAQAKENRRRQEGRGITMSAGTANQTSTKVADLRNKIIVVLEQQGGCVADDNGRATKILMELCDIEESSSNYTFFVNTVTNMVQTGRLERSMFNAKRTRAIALPGQLPKTPAGQQPLAVKAFTPPPAPATNGNGNGHNPPATPPLASTPAVATAPKSPGPEEASMATAVKDPASQLIDLREADPVTVVLRLSRWLGRSAAFRGLADEEQEQMIRELLEASRGQ